MPSAKKGQQKVPILNKTTMLCPSLEVITPWVHTAHLPFFSIIIIYLYIIIYIPVVFVFVNSSRRNGTKETAPQH